MQQADAWLGDLTHDMDISKESQQSNSNLKREHEDEDWRSCVSWTANRWSYKSQLCVHGASIFEV